MASLYDAIEVKGSTRYRLNKVFIGADKVPENVKEVLNLNNIVDENGMVIVDQKNEQAQQPTPDNEKELTGKLPRLDENKADGEGEAPATPPAEEPPADGRDTTLDHAETTSPAPTTPLQIDDSANENKEKEESDEKDSDDGGAEVSAPPAETRGPAPVVAPEPEEDKQPPAEEPKAAPSKKPARAAAPKVASKTGEVFKSKVPQTSPGMGFPRKNGRTVDVFDLETPHTKVKFVAGHAVPLSEKSFRERTDGEIANRLRELGFEPIDFNEIEREQAMSGAAPAGLLLENDETDDDIQLG